MRLSGQACRGRQSGEKENDHRKRIYRGVCGRGEKTGRHQFLAQGTIWPDILESEEGIKAHHNAGGLPEDMNFELVEPVRILFKDEVPGINRVLYDFTPKPTGTVEFE